MAARRTGPPTAIFRRLGRPLAENDGRGEHHLGLFQQDDAHRSFLGGTRSAGFDDRPPALAFEVAPRQMITWRRMLDRNKTP
jgi:hypothetical protein